MSQTRHLHPEWRESHETTNYPFADGATLRNAAGYFIPEVTFLDAILYPIGGLVGLYLSKIDVQHESATLYVGDSRNTERCYGEFNLLSPPDSVVLADAYGRPAGMLVSEPERLAIFQSWAAELHVFEVEQTEFVADVCVPTPEIGVRGFVLEDGSVFTEDVWMLGDDGIVLSLSEEVTAMPGCVGDEQTRQMIRVDAVGDVLFRRKLCQELFTTPRFLQTITVRNQCLDFVCEPGSDGDFKLTVAHQDSSDTVLRVRTVTEGLIIETVGERLKNVR